MTANNPKKQIGGSRAAAGPEEGPALAALSSCWISPLEIQQLLRAAKARPSWDPLRPWTYYCFFGLLAVTGLRLSEALNLHAEDLDSSEGILTIRGAKFGKSRLVPLHASTCKVLADYSKRRDRRFGPRAGAHFFVNKNGNRLDKGEVHRAFYALSRQIGLRAAGGGRGPRLHDFRHRADSPVMPTSRTVPAQEALAAN